MKKILMKKILINKILLKNILWKKIKYKMQIQKKTAESLKVICKILIY